MSYADGFDRQGFALIPNVFSPEEIARLRESADRITAMPSTYVGDVDNHEKLATSRADIYARYPEFQWVLFHPPLVEGLKEILGSPVVYIPEQGLQKGFYSNWHRDTTSPRRDKQAWYLKPDFRIAQVAIYLQDNTADFGGGLEVVPGSHKEVRQEWIEDLGSAMASMMPIGERNQLRLKRLLTLPARVPARFRRPVSLPIRAGDVVAFDLRIRHRASRGAASTSPAKTKYGMFMVCSANNECAKDYLTYARDFRANESMKGHAFAAELREQARRTGVILL